MEVFPQLILFIILLNAWHKLLAYWKEVRRVDSWHYSEEPHKIQLYDYALQNGQQKTLRFKLTMLAQSSLLVVLVFMKF